MNKIEVVGLGAFNMDNVYQVERILEDGETVVRESAAFPGGSAANTIYGLARLGISTGFIGAVGDDAEGKLLIEDFRKAGVDTSQIKVKPGIKSGSVLCLSDNLKRSLYVMPGANSHLTMDDIDLHYVNQVKMLHISSFADDKQFKVLLKLADRLDSSVKVSFAPGMLLASKGLKALTPMLARTYVLFINRDEIEVLTGRDVVAGAEVCLEQGSQIVTVTLGKGSKLAIGKGTARKAVTTVGYIRSDKAEYIIEPSQQAPASSVVGAGDAFAAGFLYGLLKGKGLEECGRLGNIVAQFKITRIGARPGLPTLNELSQRYQKLNNKPM